MLDIVAVIAGLVGAVGMVGVLTVLAWFSWVAVRTRPSSQSALLLCMRRRITRVAWLILAIVLVSATLREVRAASLGLPGVLSLTSLDGADKAFALLSLAAHISLAQLVLAISVVTWRKSSHRSEQRSLNRSSDVGSALVTTFGLAPAMLALVATAAVSYVHLLVHFRYMG